MNIKKNAFAIALVAGGSVLISSSAIAGSNGTVIGSRHDLSSNNTEGTSPIAYNPTNRYADAVNTYSSFVSFGFTIPANTTTAVTTTEVCVFCHTPHRGDTSAVVPLWNRILGVPASYTTYDLLGTADLDGEVLPVGSVTIACLSCHDGTQVMNNIINVPNEEVNENWLKGAWQGRSPDGTLNYSSWTNATTDDFWPGLGVDLQNDHPVGIQYGGGGCLTAAANCPQGNLVDAEFNAADWDAGSSAYYVDTGANGMPGAVNGAKDKTDMKLFNRVFGAGNGPSVECASCHDPHNGNNGGASATTPYKFLRIRNDNSAVCLTCHVK